MSVVILRGDAACLPLPDESVDLIVTSPPYWKQRDYRDQGQSMPGQIGAEETPAEYIEALLACTREWARVLKPGGSLFVNLADKYATRSGQSRSGVAEKSLLNLPHRYAIGCTDNLGLIQRGEIVWHKTSAMPESVDDRCAVRHEHLFHLTREPRYFSAVNEIREPHQPQSLARSRRNRFTPDMSQQGIGSPNTQDPADSCHPLGRLPGSVWEIPAVPLIVPEWLEHARCCGGRKRPGCEDGLGHHAAFPPALARKCILGWSPPGICLACGEGRRPVTTADRPSGQTTRIARLASGQANRAATDGGTSPTTPGVAASTLNRRITGYACACPGLDAPARPAVILDPFSGTGTTQMVASVLGRIGIGVDRSMDYARIARWRTSDPGERARALGLPKPPPVPEGQGSLFDVREAS